MAFTKFSSTDFIKSPIINLRNFLQDNITDPISSTRGTEKFVLTAYPQRTVRYPIITTKCLNIPMSKLGEQSTIKLVNETIEIRVWARNMVEKDMLTQELLSSLINIQNDLTNGTTQAGMYNFQIGKIIPVDEVGENAVKSNIININYTIFNGIL